MVHTFEARHNYLFWLWSSTTSRNLIKEKEKEFSWFTYFHIFFVRFLHLLQRTKNKNESYY